MDTDKRHTEMWSPDRIMAGQNHRDSVFRRLPAIILSGHDSVYSHLPAALPPCVYLCPSVFICGLPLAEHGYATCRYRTEPRNRDKLKGKAANMRLYPPEAWSRSVTNALRLLDCTTAYSRP